MGKMAQKEKGDKMNRKNIWIDCDPGIDDAIALAVAAGSQDKLHICGISTVAGNLTSDKVTDNALKLSSFFGLEETPVVRGAERPLVRKMEPAEDVHGENGVGGCVLPETEKKLASENGIFFMYQTIMTLPEGEKMILVPTGPLTNIALLLRTFPEVGDRIEKIVLMGGAYQGGNATPTAEFNIWTDPEAAQIVFSAQIPVVMCGLDVTKQSGVTAEQVKELCGSASLVEKACGEMLRFYFKTEADNDIEIEAVAKEKGKQNQIVGIHDVVTILYLTDPQIFGGEYVSVMVDCAWDRHRGTTMCRKEEPDPNKPGLVYMLNTVDLPRFQKILLEKIRRCASVVIATPDMGG